MAVGRYVTDLDEGDVLGPMEYVISPFVIREYAHTNEMHYPCFQGVEGQIAPPTMVHLDKLRLYEHACPMGTGPTARVHIEFDATFHAPIPAGTRLKVQGRVTRRYEKRARTYVEMIIEMRTVEDGRLLVEYRDTVLLAYKKNEAANAA